MRRCGAWRQIFNPCTPSASVNSPLPTKPPAPESPPGEVWLFGTCLVDTIYPQAGVAALELMERAGVRVLYPPGQTCCGQPPFNSGYLADARAVARQQMACFPGEAPIVAPSGSCAAMLRHHYASLFAGEPDAAQAAAFSARVWEWSDFMLRVLGATLDAMLTDSGPSVRVAYHPSCHLLREMDVREAPLALLGHLGGVEVMPLADAESCCGFGGTFSIKQADISAAMVGDKVRAVVESGAEVLVSMDAGCLMNIGGALQKAGGRAATIRVLPLPAFLLERCTGNHTVDDTGGGK